MTHVWFTLGVTVLGLSAFIAIIWLAEHKGRSELQQEQRNDEMRRLRDVLEADARARERAKSGGLYENDGYRRD